VRNSKKELPDVVFFDLDNTLYDYSSTNEFAEIKLFKHVSESLNLDVRTVKKNFQQSRLNVKKRTGHTACSHSRSLYLAEMFRVLDIRVRPSLVLEFENYFWSSFIGAIKINPSAYEVVLLLRQLKIPTVLVTDLTLNIQYRKLVRLGLDDAFDFVLTSEEVGGDKITGLPFKEAYELLDGVEKNHAWFIGDSEVDFPLDTPFKTVRYFLRNETSRIKSIGNRKIELFDRFQFFTDNLLNGN
jgi:putative hydrolase of the HAD superfamily